MSKVQASIEVDVPVSMAYNQWTQFEEFPRFMEGVESVTQLEDDRVAWIAEIGGQQRDWIAHITEQVPDRRIVWRADGDGGHDGIVTFEPTGVGSCRVDVELDYAPSGLLEKIADMLSVVERRVASDLERFKDFIESRATETGAWRGEIRDGGEVRTAI